MTLEIAIVPELLALVDRTCRPARRSAIMRSSDRGHGRIERSNRK